MFTQIEEETKLRNELQKLSEDSALQHKNYLQAKAENDEVEKDVGNYSNEVCE